MGSHQRVYTGKSHGVLEISPGFSVEGQGSRINTTGGMEIGKQAVRTVRRTFSPHRDILKPFASFGIWVGFKAKCSHVCL